MSQLLNFEDSYLHFLATQRGQDNLTTGIIGYYDLYDQLDSLLVKCGLDGKESSRPIIAGASAFLWDFDPKSDEILRIELNGMAMANKYWSVPEIIKPLSHLGKIEVPRGDKIDLMLMPKVCNM